METRISNRLNCRMGRDYKREKSENQSENNRAEDKSKMERGCTW